MKKAAKKTAVGGIGKEKDLLNIPKLKSSMVSVAKGKKNPKQPKSSSKLKKVRDL